MTYTCDIFFAQVIINLVNNVNIFPKKNWYTIDALGAIFAFLTILGGRV